MKSIASLPGFGRTLSKVVLLGSAGLFGAALSFSSMAQTYPSKPIRIIVPYSAGGAVDLVPRLLAEQMALDLGQPVYVENKSGGLGIPAILEAQKYPNDGYVIFAGDAAHWALTPALQKVPYDFVKDFVPLTQTYQTAQFVFTNTNSGITSLQDLIDKAKASQGKLNYASPGVGSIHHISMEVFRVGMGLEITHIPFKGAAEVTESVLRGDTTVGLSSLQGVLSHVKAGKLKLLAVNAGRRLATASDVPTIAESTPLKDYDFGGVQAFFVKAGTSQAIVERLNASVRKAFANKNLAAKLLDVTASDLGPNTSEQMGEKVRGDIRKFGAAIKTADIKAQ